MLVSCIFESKQTNCGLIDIIGMHIKKICFFGLRSWCAIFFFILLHPPWAHMVRNKDLTRLVDFVVCMYQRVREGSTFSFFSCTAVPHYCVVNTEDRETETASWWWWDAEIKLISVCIGPTAAVPIDPSGTSGTSRPASAHGLIRQRENQLIKSNGLSQTKSTRRAGCFERESAGP